MRMFERHSVRKQKDIGGTWQLQCLDSKGDVTGTYSVVVPSCFESIRGLEKYRGKGKYIKNINVNGGNIRLVFKGVSHTADIYLDGKHIAHHYNAYTPFDVVVTNIDEGEHTLEVIADSSFSQASALHFANDYRTFGGIIRPVEIEEIAEAYIKYIHITPTKNENGWRADIEAVIENISAEGGEFSVEFVLPNSKVRECKLDFENNNATVRTSEMFEDVNEWSPENPALYIVKAKLKKDNKVIDDLYERFGFREIKIDGDKILLNGKPIYIKGYNRHEQYANLGSAVPENIMSFDLDLVQDSGANLVRTSHYPNDERFLDMCDERGILVWEESHSRQIHVPRMKNPNFKKQIEDCIEEMIVNHYNHPSIIMWGIMNEGESNSEFGRECYIHQFEQIKRLDKSRPTTTASNRHFKDLCYDLPDIISLNIYPLWYYNEEPYDYLARIRDYVNENGGKGKPVIISEFGAGGIYGYRDFNNLKWSEPHQVDVIERIVNELYKFDDLSGLILWQFADCRLDDEFEPLSRPKCQNNKGVLDIYRRPKMAYFAISKLFGKKGNYRD